MVNYRRLGCAGVVVVGLAPGGWYLFGRGKTEETVPTNPTRVDAPRELTFEETIQGITDRYVQETQQATNNFVLGVRDKRVEKTRKYRADLETKAGEILNPERKQYLEDADRVLQEELREGQ